MSEVQDLANGEITARSFILSVYGAFSFDDFVSGTPLPFCTLPVGAIVMGGFSVISTAWNSGTSDTGILGSTDDDNEQISALDMTSATTTLITLSTKFDAGGTNTAPDIVAASDEIQFQWTGVGTAPTAGVGAVQLSYVDPTKQDENYE